MSHYIDPPTIQSQEEHMRTLLGMLTAGYNYRQDHNNTADMLAAVDPALNQADYMAILGLCMGMLFNTLLSMGIDPAKYIAMVSHQMMQDGV